MFNKKQAFKLGLAAIVVLFLLLFSGMFTVNEGESALLLRLGELTIDSKTGTARVIGPGLHFKIPFIYQVKIFDTRLQTLDIKSSRMVTREKKDVMVDYYVKWRIQNLPLYFKATGGNSYQVDTLLEQQFNTVLRAEFGKRKISDLVSGERDDVMQILKKRAAESAASLGVEVVDVRVKGIDLPSNASLSVYRRMRADMKKIANRHRADGQATAEATRAGADAEVTLILAQANSDAVKARARGQAKAARIYNDVYSQSPEFFAFYRSLNAYQNTFKNQQDILIFSPDNQFFTYFNGVGTNKNNMDSSNKN
jgi:membrane protease subunit HflC